MVVGAVEKSRKFNPANNTTKVLKMNNHLQNVIVSIPIFQLNQRNRNGQGHYDFKVLQRLLKCRNRKFH